MPVQQQPMAPMPFYADPNRFPAPVWQADPSQGWPQGQFIQQIPAAGQPIETYQQYPNGIYQATYQQPTFETNTFYTGAVQVLANPRPPSTPNQQVQLAPPRPNSNYSHTPSPSPAQQQPQQQSNTNRQYQEYNIQQQQQQNNQQQQGFIPPATTPTGNENSQAGNNSRPSSVNTIINPPTPNQNFNQQTQHQSQAQQQQPPPQQQQNNTTFTTISNFSPNSSVSYVNANSGNAQPGYPQVNSSSPQLASHNSSGYPGQEQYGGQNHQWQDDGQIMWDHQQVKIEQTYDPQQDQQTGQYMQQDNSPNKIESMHNDVQSVKTFSQSDKVNLNTRIKTMILNKQQENKMEESKSAEQNSTGHFLWYSHHHHLNRLSVDGGSPKFKPDLDYEKQQYFNQNLKSVTPNSDYFSEKRNINPYNKPEHNRQLPQQNSYQDQYERSLNSKSKYYNPKEGQPNSQTMHKSQETVQKGLNSHENDFAQNLKVECSSNEYNTCHNMPTKHDNDYNKFASHLERQNLEQLVSKGYQNEWSQNSTNKDIGQESREMSTAYQSISSQPNYSRKHIIDQNSPNYSKNSFEDFQRKPGTPNISINQPLPQMNGPNTVPLIKATHDQRKSPLLATNRCSTPDFKTPPQRLNLKLPNINGFKTPMSLDQKITRDAAHPRMVSPEKSSKQIPTDRTPLNATSDFKIKGNHISPLVIPRLKEIFSEKITSKQVGLEIPNCNCFPPDQLPPEPGTYYTHLGCANSLKSLRYDLECRTGVKGDAIRIEKVCYTGKEGKTAQGCPIAKWVIRRRNVEEKYLVIVKHRKGHVCHSAFIVICLVVWDGVERTNADELYSLLTDKLNKFGQPTKRRCATNEPRTCACQGVNEDTCGASFSFGCSWSMYYNGCKFARSKEVRKFRLTERNEELEVEEKLEKLADFLSPMYRCLAPQSFKNQCHFENIAFDCRLGRNHGRPFSGVTACMDFCAHAHKDLHNMNNGCTVVVSLTKHRSLSKPEEEQLHVLPLYVADDSDEFSSKENQHDKVKNGSIEVLEKYHSEVRTCSVPAETCLRRNRKNQEGKRAKRKSHVSQPASPSISSTTPANSPKDLPSNNTEIQNGQVSSTVLDYPNKTTWRYDNFSDNSYSWYSNRSEPVINSNGSYPPNPRPVLPQFSFFKTPYTPGSNPFSNHYSQNGYLRNSYYSPPNYYQNYYYSPNSSPTPHLSSYAAQYSNYPSYNINNPFDDLYSNNALPTPEISPYQLKDPKRKVVDISYTDNAECFRDPDIGGVAIALPHGSVLFECAKHELHATTALKQPNRLSPTRISLVFYQHRGLNKSQHGLDEYTEKMKRKLEINNSSQSDLEKSEPSDFDSKLDSSFGSMKENPGDILLRAPTLPTVSLTTMFPMYPCIVTGPFQEQLSCTLGAKP